MPQKRSPSKAQPHRAVASQKLATAAAKVAEQGDLVFALDIGTRTVVGIVGRVEDDLFKIVDAVSIPHTKRAMIDGQIEDIAQVGKIVGEVKAALEQRLKVKLRKVAIAAAGRALKTQHVRLEHPLDGKDVITDSLVKSMEIETIQKAQESLDSKRSDNDDTAFYCVGHSIVNYFLDDYVIASLVGHKGTKATIELIAAFLPSIVVESLYAVMDANALEVTNLTLEPIAAMNVIIPKEIRLINIALVDIGAGTSDIALSKDGSIVAYAMATVAGDEITEEIIRRYLVDFNTAEAMKFACTGETISYRDILGMERSVSTAEFFKTIYPAVDLLADTIADNIVGVNGAAPQAVFLIGGGSQIPGLCGIIAQKLGIDESRVAVGGHNFLKNVAVGNAQLAGPEFVTPIGIAVTATMQQSYDFSTITLNGKKVRVFDTKSLTLMDLLVLTGFKSSQMIGHSGRSLTFTLNGERRILKGGIPSAAEIEVNGAPANIETIVTQGDNVAIVPAISGENAAARICDVAELPRKARVIIGDSEYETGASAIVNGNEVALDYQIQNGDDVDVETIRTLGDIVRPLDLPKGMSFLLGGMPIGNDYVLRDGDQITCVEPAAAAPKAAAAAPAPVQAAAYVKAAPVEQPLGESIFVRLNAHTVELKPKPDKTPYLFLELLNYTDIDPTKPQGDIVLKINGRNASYLDPLSDGDKVEIHWSR